MKRVISTILAALLVLGLRGGVLASPSAKTIDVELSASSAAGLSVLTATELSTPAVTIKAGESVILTAVSLKHGSAYEDMWSGASALGTVLDEESESYISSAVFTAGEPGIYTVTYDIQMKAGKSDVLFAGNASKTIEVTGSAVVTGAEIRGLVVTPIKNSQGDIVSYLACGYTYILYSDGTSKEYGFISFYFGVNETEKDISVTVYEDGKYYTYTVRVSR